MLIELLIYCFMLIELMLIVGVDEFHWNWLNYMLLLRCVDLGMKLIMRLLCELLLKSDELKVNLMNCLRLNDWLTIWLNCVCCWEWCESGMWWDEKWDVEILIMKEWFELLRLWNWELMNLIELLNYVNLFVFDGEGGQALEGDRGKQPETSNK